MKKTHLKIGKIYRDLPVKSSSACLLKYLGRSNRGSFLFEYAIGNKHTPYVVSANGKIGFSSDAFFHLND